MGKDRVVLIPAFLGFPCVFMQGSFADAPVHPMSQSIKGIRVSGPGKGAMKCTMKCSWLCHSCP